MCDCVHSGPITQRLLHFFSVVIPGSPEIFLRHESRALACCSALSDPQQSHSLRASVFFVKGGRWWSSVNPLRCCFNFCSSFRCWCLFVFTWILVNHWCLCLLLTNELFMHLAVKSSLLVTRLYCSIKGLFYFFCICVSCFFLSVLIFNIAACSAIFQNETPANCNMTHMLNSCLRWPSQACNVISCCPWEQFNKSFKQMWCNNWSLVIFVFPFYLIERLIFQWSTE